MDIILIGGAPTVGKSTLAKLLAQHLGVPLISTDDLREELRNKTTRAEAPKLFDPEGFDTAEKYLNEFSPEQIVALERDQGAAVWPAIKKIISESETGLVIEGISILPHLITEDFSHQENIKPIFLFDEDFDRIRHTVFTRGIWDDAHTYSDGVKEKEVEWAQLFGHKLKEEVEQYNYPWIAVTKSDEDISRILAVLKI